MPNTRPASWTSLQERAFAGLAAFHTTAPVETFGIACTRSCNRLANMSGACCDVPVIFPPGRARLATSPTPTGSIEFVKTTGIVLVAFLTARAAGVVVTMRRSRLARASSAANSGNRSARPSEYRRSTTSLHVPESLEMLKEDVLDSQVRDR